jgi:hypothetical protein
MPDRVAAISHRHMSRVSNASPATLSRRYIFLRNLSGSRLPASPVSD